MSTQSGLGDHLNPCNAVFGSLRAAGLTLDLAYQGIDQKEWGRLFAKADQIGLQEQIKDLLTGGLVNTSEHRPALHTALRNLDKSPVPHLGQDVMPAIADVWQRIDGLCNKWVGVTDLIHIGIGGSDFGPRLAVQALAHSTNKTNRSMRVHFSANIDSAELSHILERAQANSTKVLIVSKSFSTAETMLNAKTIINWFKAKNLTSSQIQNSLFAITSNTKAAESFGIQKENIFPFWDWVGGRFSVWSAVGLPIALQYGFDTFKQLLSGANAMDQHFASAAIHQNLPCLLALALFYQQHKHHSKAYAVVPYAHALELFPFWLQQLDMESNGKSVDRQGNFVKVSSPTVFGSAGTNAQHSYFQLLHQGPEVIPVDFIAVKAAMSTLPEAQEHHNALLANCLAQAQALAHGKESTDPNLSYAGKRPSNLIMLPKLDAYHLGALLALYEHRTFCLGALWNLNSFDQPGVELGKVLARPIQDALKNDAPFNSDAFDGVTASRIDFLKK
ncbi:MAG: glucose-6-phosphate isomerase [Burkholderiaceae bacterium]|jgi:glucose-6-phosphate isomerase|nr:glucose-6-phosphate isomerase [Burkholderiaceae bacterium]